MLYNSAKESEFEAIQKEHEDKLYQSWVAIYPHMTKENFISYEEYKNMARQNAKQLNNTDDNTVIKSSEQTEQELIEEANKIIGMVFEPSSV